MFRTSAAILRESPGELEVTELELDPPHPGEITVRLAASGLCHSDLHLMTGTQEPAIYPFCMGHEGAGEVVAVGATTPSWSEGDHVIFSFVPMCGRCRWCASGRGNLCDLGASVFTGGRPGLTDSYRMHLDGAPVGQMCGISTFSELTTISTLSAVKVDADLPLHEMCLLGCGVSTGWGSAVNAAGLQPGQTVIVCGVGGVGTGALQGAVAAGAAEIIAVDVVRAKLEAARAFGATRGFTAMSEAHEFARTVTRGQGADAVILTVGVIDGKAVEEGLDAVRKGGTVVVTAAGSRAASKLELRLLELTMSEKRIVGSLFGSASPLEAIPRLVSAYRAGKLDLANMITGRYALPDIGQGFRDMEMGVNIRGIVSFE